MKRRVKRTKGQAPYTKYKKVPYKYPFAVGKAYAEQRAKSSTSK